MNREWLFISERLSEVSRICGREHPIYEHVSNFGLALYILGFFKCRDIMWVDDVEEVEAGCVLKEYFDPIKKEDIPSNYNILKSKEKYLLVIGDPLFPTHFAVLIDMCSLQPFFSKLKIYGTGYDSLSELESEFVGWEGIGRDDFIFYKMKQSTKPEDSLFPWKFDGPESSEFSVSDHEATNRKRKIVEVVGK